MVDYNPYENHEPIHEKVGAGRKVVPPLIPPVLYNAVDSAHHVHDMTAQSGFYDTARRQSLKSIDPHGHLSDGLANAQEYHEQRRRWFGI